MLKGHVEPSSLYTAVRGILPASLWWPSLHIHPFLIKLSQLGPQPSKLENQILCNLYFLSIIICSEAMIALCHEAECEMFT